MSDDANPPPALPEEDANPALPAEDASPSPVPSDDEDDDDNSMDMSQLRNMLAGLTMAKPAPEILDTADLAGVAKYILDNDLKNIVVMAGAGVSTAAGLPDFRTPGTGLYDNLQRFDLPEPTAVFQIDFFRDKPEPFFLLAKELYPGGFQPTMTHCFFKLLQEQGRLLRVYTQNIDCLERQAGLPGDVLVEAHGSFAQGHCIGCRKEFSQGWIKERVFADQIPRCDVCDQLVKPDIVFFGEDLPDRFRLYKQDFPQADLLIILGTSLTVQPFASLVDAVADSCPRLLINRDRVGEGNDVMRFLGLGGGLDFDNGKRDVHFAGTCDDGVQELARLLSLEDKLLEVFRRFHPADTGAAAAAEKPEAAAADPPPASDSA